jgi:hypothetical protein
MKRIGSLEIKTGSCDHDLRKKISQEKADSRINSRVAHQQEKIERGPSCSHANFKTELEQSSGKIQNEPALLWHRGNRIQRKNWQRKSARPREK